MRKLTDEYIKGLGTPETVIEVRDEETTGLLVRVQPRTGLKTFYFAYCHHGQRTRLKLGQFGKAPDLTVAAARKLARAKRTQLDNDKDPGATARANRQTMTLRTFLDAFYFPWVRIHRKSHRTIHSALIKGFAHLLDRCITSLSQADFTACQTAWVADGTAAKTQNNRMRVLQSALQFGVDNGHITDNPARGRWKAVTVDTAPQFSEISKDEEAVVLDLLSDDLPFRALFVTSLDAGLRRGEALVLDWRNVDLDAGILRIVGAMAKSGNSRVIPMTRRVRGVLSELHHLHGEPEEGRLWPISGSLVALRWQQLKAEAGITRALRWHDLRASCLTRLCRAGVPVHIVAALAGHSSVKITEKYLRRTDNDLTEAIKALE